MRSKMLILMYHNVISSSEDLPVIQNQVTEEIFSKHINLLKNRILHPLDVSQSLRNGNSPEGILISFDDGGHGIIEAGRILASVGKAGVAFVCGSEFKNGLWFYHLANALSLSTRTNFIHNRTQINIQGYQSKKWAYELLSNYLFNLLPAERDQMLTSLVEYLLPDNPKSNSMFRVLDEVGAQEAANTGGILFANHSWSHPNLTTLPSSILKFEVEQTLFLLNDLGLPMLDWFAFPRGKYNEEICTVALEKHSALFGAEAHQVNQMVLPRVGIYKKDAKNARFLLKILFGGSLPRFLSMQRSGQRL